MTTSPSARVKTSEQRSQPRDGAWRLPFTLIVAGILAVWLLSGCTWIVHLPTNTVLATPPSVPQQGPQTTTFSSPLKPEVSPFVSPLPAAKVIGTSASSAPALAGAVLSGTIAFHSERSGNYDIWTMSADGTNLRQLTDDPCLDVDPAWSPDGSKIAFATSRDDPENLSIYVMNADGSDQRRLVKIPGADSIGPAWSPDGTRIAFHSNAGGNFDLYVVNTDGTNLTNLAQHPANDFRPDWSPDGKRIAFVSDRDNGENIYILELADGKATRLTSGLYLDGLPKWSPDGTRVLFESNRAGVKGLFTVLADGSSEPVPVLAPPMLDDSPAWADMGRFILFSSQRTGDWEIYLVRSDGSDIRRLTSSRGFDRFPAWKP